MFILLRFLIVGTHLMYEESKSRMIVDTVVLLNYLVECSFIFIDFPQLENYSTLSIYYSYFLFALGK